MLLMPRKTCQYLGCSCSEGLTEVAAAQEDFASASSLRNLAGLTSSAGQTADRSK